MNFTSDPLDGLLTTITSGLTPWPAAQASLDHIAPPGSARPYLGGDGLRPCACLPSADGTIVIHGHQPPHLPLPPLVKDLVAARYGPPMLTRGHGYPHRYTVTIHNETGQMSTRLDVPEVLLVGLGERVPPSPSSRTRPATHGPRPAHGIRAATPGSHHELTWPALRRRNPRVRLCPPDRRAQIIDQHHPTPETLIVLERWAGAVIAYGAVAGTNPFLLRARESVLVAALPVDHTILLDVPGTLAAARLAELPGTNRFETIGSDYLERVRRQYRAWASMRHIPVLNGRLPTKDLAAQITDLLGANPVPATKETA